MIDERIIELYRSQLAAANEEKGMLYAHVKALTEEVSMLRSSMQDTSQRIDELLSEISRHEVTIEWIKGHAGHPENERCDELAVMESKKFI